jgi:hypothetical protein
MMTTAELSEQLPEIQDIRVAIDAALKDGMIVPLDSEKGVFTSRIHLLDELSIQALSQEASQIHKSRQFHPPGAVRAGGAGSGGERRPGSDECPVRRGGHP